jgi:hypothetical protein
MTEQTRALLSKGRIAPHEATDQTGREKEAIQTSDGARGRAFRALRCYLSRYELVQGLRSFYETCGSEIQNVLRRTNNKYIALCDDYSEDARNPPLTLRLGMEPQIYAMGKGGTKIEIREGLFELPGYGQVNLGTLVICVDEFLILLIKNAEREINRMCDNMKRGK